MYILDSLSPNNKEEWNVHTLFKHEALHIQYFIEFVNKSLTTVNNAGATCTPEECDGYRLEYIKNMVESYYWENISKDASLHAVDYPVNERGGWSNGAKIAMSFSTEEKLKADKSLADWHKCINTFFQKK